GRSFHGMLRSNLYARASVGSTTLRRYPLGSPHGRITPSRIDRLWSPSTRSALTSRRVPSPEQSGQAPYGELNENCRGSSSGSDSPHLGQAYRSENIRERGLPVCRTTSTTPSAALSAVSIESASLPRSAARTTSRSTTTAMSWFWRRLSLGTSDR